MRIAIEGGGDFTPLYSNPPTTSDTAPNVTPASDKKPADAPRPSAPGASGSDNTVAPLPPVDKTPSGIDEKQVESGDTVWSIYRQLGLFKDWNHTDATIAQNLPATPWLDPQAFGTRPGNPVSAVKDMQPGAIVTVLDGKRLDFLGQQRAALKSYDSIRGPMVKLYDPQDRQAMFDAVLAPVQNEIEYSTLGMPVPSQADLDQIAKGIKARAPDDPHLQSAVDTAVANVQAELEKWGRTPDQLGKIMSDASAGNAQQLSTDMQQQLLDVGKATLASTKGDAAQAETAIRAREGVYATYLGTQNAGLVTKALTGAEKQLFVDEPVGRITQAYDTAYAKGGKDAAAQAAAAAAQQLRIETDPNAKLPGKVAQIAADPQVQQIMRKIAQSIGGALNEPPGRPPAPPASTTLADFSAAMQNTFDSDDPSLGMSQGKETVDKMAGYLIDAIGNGKVTATDAMTQHGGWLVGVLTRGLGEDGNAALPAALAAQGNARGNVLMSKAGDAALAGGIDEYNSTKLKPLQEKAAQVLVPLQRAPKKDEWGSLQTQAEKDATTDKLQKGILASDLTDIVNGQTAAMQEYAKFKGVLDRYGSALKGEGYDSDANFNNWWSSTSGSVTSTVASFEKAAGFDAAKAQAGKIPFTQFWWQSRVANGSLKFFSQQMAHQALAGVTPSDDGHGVLRALFGTPETGGAGLLPRSMTGLMGGLFLSNSLVASDAAKQTAGKHDFASQAWTLDNEGFAALYSTLGASQLMNFVAPNWKTNLFGTNAAGAPNTPQRQILDAALQRVEASEMSDASKRMMSSALRTALSGTSDLAGGLVAWGGLIPMVMQQGSTNPAHEFAYATAGVADLGTYAARSMLQSGVTFGAEDIAGETLAGLTVDGWTGVGFVLNIAAAGVQLLANQDDVIHQADSVSKYLEAEGVPHELADPFARHMLNDHLGGTSAGPFLTAYFRAKGKTNEDMIDWMKSVKNGDTADSIATYAKEQDIFKHDKDGNAVLTPDQVAQFDAYLDSDVGSGGFKPGAQVHP
ncbi:MAG: hypothetical protein ACTHKH_11085 [Trinickia sp.]